MCAITGVILKKPARGVVRMIMRQLLALQTRGGESCGFAYSDPEGVRIHTEKGMGTVEQVMTEEIVHRAERKKPRIIIGHNRYSTTGGSSLTNAHPFWLEDTSGRVALAVNGNIPDAKTKMKTMEKVGAVFYTDSDTEFMLKYIFEAAGKQLKNIARGIEIFMKNVPGTYSACLIIREKLFLFRDPFANRPFSYGFWHGNFVFSSETGALEKIGAKVLGDVPAGVIMEIDLKNRIKIKRVFSQRFCRQNCQHCIFEAIYFARPDSIVFEKIPVAIFRQALSAMLFQEIKVKPEVVCPVPDSSNQAAIGYQKASGCKLENLIIKDSVARTFIMPGQKNRVTKARLKYSVVSFLAKLYKIIMVIDDSIVRSTTMKILIAKIRRAVGKSVKIIISIPSPKIKFPCFYGIDMPTKKELVAARLTTEKIRQKIGADELYYLSLPGLKETIRKTNLNPNNFCFTCFDGHYKIPLRGKMKTQ